MKVVGVRELKNRLSEYLRLVRQGEDILVTDRGEVIAALRDPGASRLETPYPGLRTLVRQGRVRQGLENHADLYPQLPGLLPRGEIARLLDAERGPR
jgi:antitoxin (DNA-binding transcriptional repressor) of toxin-antitoxin stability system